MFHPRKEIPYSECKNFQILQFFREIDGKLSAMIFGYGISALGTKV